MPLPENALYRGVAMRDTAAPDDAAVSVARLEAALERIGRQLAQRQDDGQSDRPRPRAADPDVVAKLDDLIGQIRNALLSFPE